MTDRKEYIVNELKRLKSLSLINKGQFSLSIREKNVKDKKSGKSLLPALTIFYAKPPDSHYHSYILIIQFLNEAEKMKTAERRYKKLLNSPLADNFDFPGNNTYYKLGSTVKCILCNDVKKIEEAADTLLYLCRLFSEKGNLDIECTFNYFQDLNNNPHTIDHISKSDSFSEAEKLISAIETTVQNLLFYGFTWELEIFKGKEGDCYVQSIIFTADELNEKFSLYLHSPRFDNEELEGLFSRIRTFHLNEYITNIEMYDNELDTRLDLNYQNILLCRGFIISYLKLIYPDWNIHSLHTDIIDICKL